MSLHKQNNSFKRIGISKLTSLIHILFTLPPNSEEYLKENDFLEFDINVDKCNLILF